MKNKGDDVIEDEHDANSIDDLIKIVTFWRIK